MTEKTFEKYKLVIDAWFANGFNGVKAYQKIYPSASEVTADAEFRRIHGIPRLKAYADSKKAGSQKKLRTSHEDLLKMLDAWVYSDVTEVINLTPEEVKALPVEIRRLITGFETKTRRFADGSEVTTVKCTFVSKEKAAEMIHKHTGFYAEHNFQKNVELSSAERQELIARMEERKKRLEQRELDSLL